VEQPSLRVYLLVLPDLIRTWRNAMGEAERGGVSYGKAPGISTKKIQKA